MGFEEKEFHNKYQETRKGQLKKDLEKVNMKNLQVMEELKGVSPKYAAHMMQSNSLIESFAMRMAGGLDILDQPVCRSCERPAAWDHGGSAYCFACNTKTQAKDVITVKQYLIEYTKGIPKEQLELFAKLSNLEKGEKENGIIT